MASRATTMITARRNHRGRTRFMFHKFAGFGVVAFGLNRISVILEPNPYLIGSLLC
jgi:hypothetical protein